MTAIVTVAVPTLDAGPAFADTLDAISAQQVDRELELLICDSGSADGTVALARAHGARVLTIPRTAFSHGTTRNLLMEQARGDHVAFLTQDAVPAHRGWLQALLSAFAVAENVGLAFGPYRPRPDTKASAAREIVSWFDSFPTGPGAVVRLAPELRSAPDRAFLGHLGFFTDANGCVSRAAWERVPFQAVTYAEDHRLAQDMLRSGYAKVYVPDAPVIHAHEYSRWDWLRRSFDESRAVHEVYGWAPDARTVLRDVRGAVMGDLRAADHAHMAVALAALGHHGTRGAGTLLGPRSGRWPPLLVRRLSLEGRS